MKALCLQRIALNVSNLQQAEPFYTQALGFTRTAPPTPDPVLATLLGATRVISLHLRRGRQHLQLTKCDPPGEPFPPPRHSNDPWFQHSALATDNIADAYARLRHSHFTRITCQGPQTLPGGITAFKFRDPDGHPLELIQFPAPNPATQNGIDHSAIVVRNAEASIEFYQSLGLTVTARQTNTGPTQSALDDLPNPVVGVIALSTPAPAPHLELLAYQSPQIPPPRQHQATAIAATRIVLTTTSSTGLISDPDHHTILLEQSCNNAAL